MEVVALVVSVASAAGAGFAAWYAKRSADAAEDAVLQAKRSADAAEHSVDIERERRQDELRERERAAIPALHAGETTGAVWRLAEKSLSGMLENDGPDSAIIASLGLHMGEFGDKHGGWAGDRAAILRPGEQLPVSFPWEDEPRDLTLKLRVKLVTAFERDSYLIEFTLYPAGEDEEGTPLWKAARSATARTTMIWPC